MSFAICFVYLFDFLSKIDALLSWEFIIVFASVNADKENNRHITDPSSPRRMDPHLYSTLDTSNNEKVLLNYTTATTAAAAADFRFDQQMAEKQHSIWIKLCLLVLCMVFC